MPPFVKVRKKSLAKEQHILQPERCVKIKLKEVEHTTCNYVLPYILHELTVPHIHQPFFCLSDARCCYPIAVLSCT